MLLKGIYDMMKAAYPKNKNPKQILKKIQEAGKELLDMAHTA